MPPLFKSGDQRRADEPRRTANEYVLVSGAYVRYAYTWVLRKVSCGFDKVRLALMLERLNVHFVYMHTTLTGSSPGRREVGEALGAWWGSLVRSGRRTPGPSCFRRSDLAGTRWRGGLSGASSVRRRARRGPSERRTLLSPRRCRSSPC